jgi:UDP-N-acetylmuramyl pentapeptide phosphotransferase/UDP-N-acetylglucosamine-1-phosphate transferase
MIYLFIFFIYFFNEIFLKKKIFIDKIEFSKHKSFINTKKVPTTGGLYVLIFLSLFYVDINFMNLLFLMLIYLTGLSSDRLKNFSPKIRLLLQILITFLFIINSNTFILDTRIDSLNYLFNNYKYTSIFFTIFCFIILINGTNFIDGTNLNTIGYYIIIYSAVYYLSKKFNLALNFDFNLKIILFLCTLYVLNYLNKIQLGDSGSYLLSFFSAFYLIHFVNNNSYVSPYFIILILWYPCFENLFSILRKIYQKKKISAPDNFHLHHCLYKFLKNKNFRNLNNLSGFIINLTNLIFISFGTLFLNSTKNLVLLLLVYVLIYIFSYNYLIRKNLRKKLF